jgi:sigma-E factor negative regulatory protein RseC
MARSDNFGTIEHAGIVQKSDNISVTVIISSESACSGCHAEGFCSLSGKEDKIIDIPGRYNVEPGQTVTVLMKKSMGYSAVMLGYVVPLILVIALVIILGSMSLPELITGLGSIAVLVPYYLILWLFRKRINNNFRFTIK